MIILNIHYTNRTEYYPLNSLWAANLIAINRMRNDENITDIEIVDNNTGAIETHYIRQAQ